MLGKYPGTMLVSIVLALMLTYVSIPAITEFSGAVTTTTTTNTNTTELTTSESIETDSTTVEPATTELTTTETTTTETLTVEATTKETTATETTTVETTTTETVHNSTKIGNDEFQTLSMNDIAIQYGNELERDYPTFTQEAWQVWNSLMEEKYADQVICPRIFLLEKEYVIVFIDSEEFNLFLYDGTTTDLNCGAEECIDPNTLPVLPNLEKLEEVYIEEVEKGFFYGNMANMFAHIYMDKLLNEEKSCIGDVHHPRFFNENGNVVAVYLDDGYLWKDTEKLCKFNEFTEEQF